MRAFLIFTLLSLTYCNQVKTDYQTSNRDKINVENPKKIFSSANPILIDINLNDRLDIIPTSSIVDADHQIVKLETTDDCLIGEISKVIIKNNKIFVLDSKIAKKLFCFDLRGKYLYTVGELGEGPGEMDTPRDFDVTQKEILIIDRQCRVFTFSLLGEYQTTLRLPFLSTQLCAFEDNSVFYYSNSASENLNSYLTQIKSRSVVSSDFGLQSQVVEGYSIPQAFHRRDSYALFVKFLCDTIFTLSPSKVQPSYIINFHGEAYPPNTFYDKNVLDEVYNSPDRYGKLFNMHLAETSKDLFFLTSKNGINYHFFSKILGKHIFASGVYDDYMFGGLAVMFPVGSYQEYLIYPISIPNMIEGYKALENEAIQKGVKAKFLSEFSKSYTDFIGLCESSKKDDNPSILLTRINSKIYER